MSAYCRLQRQIQRAVTAYFLSEQLLLFVFAGQTSSHISLHTGDLSARRRRQVKTRAQSTEPLHEHTPTDTTADLDHPRRSRSVDSMLGQRRRRWHNIESTLCERLVCKCVYATFFVIRKENDSQTLSRLNLNIVTKMRQIVTAFIERSSCV